MMRAFPGSFPPSEFVAMDLESYGDAYALAVAELEAQAAALSADRE